MQTILESPIYIGVVGTALTILCLWVALQTGYKLLMWAAILAAVVTAALVTVSVRVVTPREEVIAWLNDAAADLEANRIEELEARIHPAAADEVHQVRLLADRVRVKQASIRSIHEVTVTGSELEPRAVAKFNVFVECEVSGTVHRVPRYVELTLYKVDGRWLVYAIRHEEPTYAMRKHDPEE